MSKTAKSLFKVVVDKGKVSPEFDAIRTLDVAHPARQMLETAYQEFNDPDGNFVEQFQTTGFNARYFELYLFAFFLYSRYSIDRSHPNPDFLITRNGLTVAVEATTINPSTSGVLSKVGKRISELLPEDLVDYENHELPIRFGSPLISKLRKKYWNLDHCRDIPLTIAIEAFHDKDAHTFSDSALIGYLYGLRQAGSWSQAGTLEIESSTVETHKVDGKEIPSGFFQQPEASHVSAVLFTNSGTNAKFSRMGYQFGFGCDSISLERAGFCFNPAPNAMDPTYFYYSLDAPPFVESWGQGLVVLHNPNALRPLPRDFFPEVVQGYIEDGDFTAEHHTFHPIISKTFTFEIGEMKQKIPAPLRNCGRIAIPAIEKEHFQEMCGFSFSASNPILEEHGWFSDETNSFLGVVIRDKIDDDWGYVVLGRDSYFEFRAIKVESDLASREKARLELQMKMAQLLSNPQRIFVQHV